MNKPIGNSLARLTFLITIHTFFGDLEKSCRALSASVEQRAGRDRVVPVGARQSDELDPPVAHHYSLPCPAASMPLNPCSAQPLTRIAGPSPKPTSYIQLFSFALNFVLQQEPQEQLIAIRGRRGHVA